MKPTISFYHSSSGIAVILVFLMTCSLLMIYPSASNAQDKPNVLLIMTDTQRKDDMGAYGTPVIKTPNLDMLARGGAMFQNCHVQIAGKD